ncbi:MAG: ATP-dependent helicase [Acidimicrobiales bacterium]
MPSVPADPLLTGLTDPLLAGLTEAQTAAVTSPATLLCVQAGAGSGKTTVLTRRVAWRAGQGDTQPDHTLVVTFTRKAAAELRSRLRRLGVHGVEAGTFHGCAYSQLRRHWIDRGVRAPAVAADPMRLLRDVVTEEHCDPDVVRALARELGWARARMIGPSSYPQAAAEAGRVTEETAVLLGALMGRYEQRKRRRGVIDMDDMLSDAAHLIESDETVAAAFRWRIRHLFVDEFQDVNPAQWRLLEAWRGGRDDLCVVGDERQAVYAWNGSDPGLLARLPTMLPGMAVVHLDENHRSTGSIVNAAAAVLGSAHRAPRAQPDAEGPAPRVEVFDTDDDEAAAVVRWLRAARAPGVPWRHAAVLARTNARLDPVANALGRAGIPFRRTSRARRDAALAPLLEALRHEPRRRPLRSAVDDVAALASEGVAESDFDPTGETEATRPREAPQPSAASGESAVSMLRELVDECAQQEPGPTVGIFLDWLAANPDALDEKNGLDAVTLATFHRAKGLEWRAVAVIGVESGLVPLAYATSEAARDEERRLLYVALTRARRDLWCSGAGTPSPYLRTIASAPTASAPTDPEAVAAHIASIRHLLVAG